MECIVIRFSEIFGEIFGVTFSAFWIGSTVGLSPLVLLDTYEPYNDFTFSGPNESEYDTPDGYNFFNAFK